MRLTRWLRLKWRQWCLLVEWDQIIARDRKKNRKNRPTHDEVAVHDTEVDKWHADYRAFKAEIPPGRRWRLKWWRR